MNSKAQFHLTRYAHNISLKHNSALNTCSNDFIRTYIKCVMSRKWENHFVSHCGGESGVAGEGRVVGVLKFNSWGKCTMPLTNISSDWNIIFIVLFTWVLYFASWGVINLYGSFISHLGV